MEFQRSSLPLDARFPRGMMFPTWLPRTWWSPASLPSTTFLTSTPAPIMNRSLATDGDFGPDLRRRVEISDMLRRARTSSCGLSPSGRAGTGDSDRRPLGSALLLWSPFARSLTNFRVTQGRTLYPRCAGGQSLCPQRPDKDSASFRVDGCFACSCSGLASRVCQAAGSGQLPPEEVGAFRRERVRQHSKWRSQLCIRRLLLEVLKRRVSLMRLVVRGCAGG